MTACIACNNLCGITNKICGNTVNECFKCSDDKFINDTKCVDKTLCGNGNIFYTTISSECKPIK